MRKYLLILALLFPLLLNGQSILSGSVASIATGAASTEMLTNGTLTSGTSWAQTGGFALTGNAATFDDVTNGSIYQLPADMITNVQANTAYTLTFDVTGTSGFGIYMNITSADNGDGTETFVAIAEYTNGSKTVNFTTPADVRGGGFRISASTAGDSGGTIDNISLKPQ